MATESKVKGVAAALAATKKNQPAKKAPAPPAKKRAKKDPVPSKTEKAAAQKKRVRKEGEQPSTGQSAPPIELSVERLNAKEMRVLEVLHGNGGKDRPVLRIDALAALCFKAQGEKRSNSWVRNSLRRLIQGGLVEKVNRGHYRISDTGRSRLAAAA